MEIRIRRGLDLKLPGAPPRVVVDGQAIDTVAVQGADYAGLRAELTVAVGDSVARGEALFVDGRRPRIAVTAPAAGEVIAIERGARRTLASIVIRCQGDAGVRFDVPAATAGNEAVRALLLESGLWPSFLARPFGRVPDVDAIPDAIFVNAMDTNPLAADPAVVLAPSIDRFRTGLQKIALLTDGPVYVCQAPGHDFAGGLGGRIAPVAVRGPHPAGLSGTHIHRVAPVGGGRTVWQIDYQHVIAIGALFETGELSCERIVALTGPGIERPSLVRTVAGADIDALLAGNLKSGPLRILSGSALNGRISRYLGHYHQQVTVLIEGSGQAGFFGGLRRTADGTGLGGRPGPIIPGEAYEAVLPLAILPVPLLRALSVGDHETAARLGCLELLEEDMALLSYVCPGKADYADLLRQTLDALAEDLA